MAKPNPEILQPNSQNPEEVKTDDKSTKVEPTKSSNNADSDNQSLKESFANKSMTDKAPDIANTIDPTVKTDSPSTEIKSGNTNKDDKPDTDINTSLKWQEY